MQWRRQQGGLPMGFRFRPSDEDLVNFYLRAKLSGNSSVVPGCLIKDLDVYQHDPEDLPHGDAAFPYRARDNENEMYFFTPIHPTSPGSKRVNRRAGGGLWDCHAPNVRIGKDEEVIGYRTQLNFKILVNGNKKKIKSGWIMQEYRLKPDQDPASGGEEDFDAIVLCKIYRMNRKASGGVQSHDAASFGEEEDNDGGGMGKKQRIKEPLVSSQLCMAPAPAVRSWEGDYKPMVHHYREPFFPSSVPLASSDTGNHASTSASIISPPRFADCGASAKPLLNTINPIEQPLRAIGAEHDQVPTEEPLIVNIGEALAKLGAYLARVPLPLPSSEGACEHLTSSGAEDHVLGAEYQIATNDSKLMPWAEDSLAGKLESSNDAGNHTSPSSSQDMRMPLQSMEGAHKPLPSPGADNHVSFSASTVPTTLVCNDHDASAQAQVNTLREEPSVFTDDYGEFSPEFDRDIIVSSMKDCDQVCFSIDELLGYN